jgi:hypothetical protein
LSWLNSRMHRQMKENGLTIEQSTTFHLPCRHVSNPELNVQAQHTYLGKGNIQAMLSQIQSLALNNIHSKMADEMDVSVDPIQRQAVSAFGGNNLRIKITLFKKENL